MHHQSQTEMSLLVFVLGAVWLFSWLYRLWRIRPVVVTSMQKGLPTPARAARAMKRIVKFWPNLYPYIPRDVSSFSSGTFLGDGICSHPEFARTDYQGKGAGLYVLQDRYDLPRDFAWIGLHWWGAYESLFVFCIRDWRLFWFYDPYLVVRSRLLHQRDRTHSSVTAADTARRLNEALQRWNDSSRDVMYDGFLGWFEPRNGSRQPMPGKPERRS